MDDALSLAGKLLSDTLKRQIHRVVLAESCTGGLVAATLARNPGISGWLCGSFVTYRNDSKARWLGVPETLLQPPGPGAVSEEVARAMALGALNATPEASYAAAITGDLGPQLDQTEDGLIWIAIARRLSDDRQEVLDCWTERLPASAEPGFSVRETRQRLAARLVLERLQQVLLPHPLA